MPTYEYKCSKCGYIFEKFQSITAPPYKECPKCRGSVKRLIGTGSGIIFKGSGFYTTDYRSQSYKKDLKKETDKSDKPSKDDRGKSEKKQKNEG